MNLLWIVVLIQTLFFIVHNEHFYVLMFIGISLCINAFSKKEWFYLGIPFLVVFIIYFFAKHNRIKGFNIEPYSGDMDTAAIMDAHNDSVNMMAQQQKTLDQIIQNQLFLAEQLSG